MWMGHLHFDDWLDYVGNDVVQKEAVVGNQESHKRDQLRLDTRVQQNLEK